MQRKFQCLRSQLFNSLGDATELLRLFDFLPGVYLYVKDRQGRFVGMNAQWVEMRGAQSQDELIGKTDADLHPLYWARQYQEEDRRVMESAIELPNQVWLVPAGDGKLSTFVSSKIPIHGRKRDVIGIAGVMYQSHPSPTDNASTNPTEIATDIIAARFRGPLEIKQIAAEVNLSVSQLNRRFRDSYQISPSEYLQRVRIHEASRLLADSDLSIGVVALDCGFYDQAHLSRSFKKRFGMTPREFRIESQES
ncbi:Regulatory protein PchR [Rubripirellula amarantea]|uniref:Regulatory protein PchR n=1 Tax=Rubripirellula amarantea TaxID=2527999 RepID=A0A5C5WMF9_9BACT|nr:helix-turn-helix domain-containing protein [Rubripirellula amarantea]TWT51279.1 Regulatory protein PchR [Rubripirellula amarantea]